eukprot:6801880-Alexandrium_andersonii.AAC.1
MIQRTFGGACRVMVSGRGRTRRTGTGVGVVRARCLVLVRRLMPPGATGTGWFGGSGSGGGL